MQFKIASKMAATVFLLMENCPQSLFAITQLNVNRFLPRDAMDARY